MSHKPDEHEQIDDLTQKCLDMNQNFCFAPILDMFSAHDQENDIDHSCMSYWADHCWNLLNCHVVGCNTRGQHPVSQDS